MVRRGRNQIVAVMAGLVPAIHGLIGAQKRWMPGTSAGMTAFTHPARKNR
jgi:hypothetical protein